MAVSLLQSHEVSDLCIGKPPLRSLPPSAAVGEALAALKRGGDAFLGVWASPERGAFAGKVCMVDVLCFLCAEDNIASPAAALDKPVSALIPKGPALVRRVEPHSSLLESLDAILDGAQSLVVPIRSASAAARKKPSAAASPEFCWLTPEDFVRFFLSSIALFSPAAALSVSALGVVRPASLAVRHYDPALSAVPLLRAALAEQTSVAVLADDGRRLIGEISPSTLVHCADESAAAALAVLSAGDLMSFLDCFGAPPESTLRAVKYRLADAGLLGMLDLLDPDVPPPFSSSSSSSASSASSSSDDDDEPSPPPTKPRRARSMGSYSARMGRRSEEAIVCHPRSSLVAVMIQALAHRVSYVWVVDDDDDYALVGIVRFADMLRVFRGQIQHQPLPEGE
ncbi:CBS domain-containing protein CBSX5 [Ananas comosus]|uniref:CBS domain-containing protein CBSX5 n=1 Tax=Ananas comosus TaxID=4615 RepID=A0A6P5HS11_ANACO|nr:CBS domain-containing protein CBSX5 [Ananas comosus]